MSVYCWKCYVLLMALVWNIECVYPSSSLPHGRHTHREISFNQTQIRLYLKMVTKIWFGFDLIRFGEDFSVCMSPCMHRNLFLILVKLSRIGLYMPFSTWFSTKRNFVWSIKSIAIQIWYDFTINFQLCQTLNISNFHLCQTLNFSTSVCIKLPNMPMFPHFKLPFTPNVHITPCFPLCQTSSVYPKFSHYAGLPLMPDLFLLHSISHFIKHSHYIQLIMQKITIKPNCPIKNWYHKLNKLMEFPNYLLLNI